MNVTAVIKKITQLTKGDFAIWMIVILLSLFSMAVIYSATGTLAYQKKGGHTEFYLFKQLLFVFVGFLIIYFCHLVDYRYYSRVAQMLWLASIPLLLYTILFGSDVNDAKRWITLPIINTSFQTSDLAKIALIMFLARMLSKKQDEIKEFRKAFLPILISVTVICLLIFPANLSTAAVLFMTSIIIMFIGRIKVKYILILLACGIVLLAAAIFTVKILPVSVVKKMGRVATWQSRLENYGGDDKTASYQNEQAKIAIATGGLFGKGPGKSTQRNFLPNPYADFVYATIIEEYGLFGAFIVIALYLLLLYRTIRIAMKSPRAFGALLAIGLSFSLVIQAFINMAVAVNIFPVTGLPLPLVSMGGTSLWFTCFAFGCILSVSRHIDENEEILA
ncbi:MAG: FtsW/RodA/SpoVE family cell cycle protein, partial [Bacteroidetes bacterium]|nr:FtsW/RodA/SpoVE family cell cycle protein [Bacteroidota bacterium]